MTIPSDSKQTFDRTTRGQAETAVGPCLEFDLPKEIEQLKGEDAWRSGRNARTLIKTPDLRIVLTVLRANARVDEHRVNGTVAIHTVSGHTCIHAGDRKFDLPAGHLLALAEDLPHDVEAVTDSAFLVTIAWPNTNNR